MSDTTRWPGKVVLVTGGASGVGAASARRFAELGARVVLVDVDPGGRQLADELDGVFCQFDVGDFEAWTSSLSGVVSRLGGLDLVHLNAGVTTRPSGMPWDTDSLLTLTEPLYRRIIGVNLDGVVFGVIATVPYLEGRGGGHIVVTASVSGLEAMPSDPFYAMTKHATIGLVRSLGPVLVARHITIQALCPLGIDTPMISDEQRIPGRSFASPSEVVDALEHAIDDGASGDVWVAQAPGLGYRRHQFAPARS